MFSRLKKLAPVVAFWFGLCAPLAAFAQTATLLPNAVQQYFKDDGTPAALGRIYYYVPNTTTLKNTWQNSGKTALNQNPIPLDAAGRPDSNAAGTYGDGVYRQQVQDADGNIIWDALTSSTGGSGGGGGTTYIGDGLSVGTVIPYAGTVVPSQYLWANGQAISRATYPELLASLTLTLTVSCVSGLNVISGFSDTTTIRVGAPIETACLAPGTTITGVGSTTATVSTNATVTTATVARIFTTSNGNGSTTFNLPDYRGSTLIGRLNMGGPVATTINGGNCGVTPLGLNVNCGNQQTTLVQANLPNVNFTVADPGHAHGYQPANPTNVSITYTAGAVGFSAGGLYPGAGSTSSSITSIAVGSGGTDTPFSRIQPSIAIDYIVKAIPDDASSIVGGVASIGGMQGIIACGQNVTCSGNTISVITSASNLVAADLATTAALAANTYNNGAAGVGATLTANANGALSVDGTAVSVAQRILVRNEATTANNGVYVVTATGSGGAAYVLTRATDFDQAVEMVQNASIFVSSGATLVGSRWALQSAVATVGTDPIVWVQTSAPSSVTSIGGAAGAILLGSGLQISGQTISTKRMYLTGATTFYVRTDGNDANTGLVNNAGGAWLDPQYALNYVRDKVDTAGFAVTIKFGETTLKTWSPPVGGYTCDGAFTGGGVVTIEGDSSGTNTVVSGLVNNGAAYTLINGCRLNITFQVVQSGANSNTINVINQSYLGFQQIRWAGAINNDIYASRLSNVQQDGADVILAGAGSAHLHIQHLSEFRNTGQTTIFGADATYGLFAYAPFVGVIVYTAGASINLNTFTVTGLRCSASFNGVIEQVGLGANFFPGNSACTTATGGQLIQ